ncbi:hypothetical protein WKI65_43645 [Streptomyces sp. MS1.AVA.3]|uniref:hypothetical protein n=1 Tax=Streptomyces decoyicus TaxID=249567 RepID=UPI0030C3C6F2
MATATVPAKVKASKATLVDDDELYEGPTRSTVLMLMALLVGVLSLIDYCLNDFGDAVAHLSYFGSVVIVFRVFFGLAFGGSGTDSEPAPEPDAGS